MSNTFNQVNLITIVVKINYFSIKNFFHELKLEILTRPYRLFCVQTSCLIVGYRIFIKPIVFNVVTQLFVKKSTKNCIFYYLCLETLYKNYMIPQAFYGIPW